MVQLWGVPTACKITHKIWLNHSGRLKRKCGLPKLCSLPVSALSQLDQGAHAMLINFLHEQT